MKVLVGGEQGCRPAAKPSRESWLQGVKGPCGASGCGAEELPCVSDGSCGAFPPCFVISSMGLQGGILVWLCSYPPLREEKHTRKDPPLPLLPVDPLIACCWEDGAVWSSPFTAFRLMIRCQPETSQWQTGGKKGLLPVVTCTAKAVCWAESVLEAGAKGC